MWPINTDDYNEERIRKTDASEDYRGGDSWCTVAEILAELCPEVMWKTNVKKELKKEKCLERSIGVQPGFFLLCAVKFGGKVVRWLFAMKQAGFDKKKNFWKLSYYPASKEHRAISGNYPLERKKPHDGQLLANVIEKWKCHHVQSQSSSKFLWRYYIHDSQIPHFISAVKARMRSGIIQGKSMEKPFV